MPKNHPQASSQAMPYELAIGQHPPGHESYKNEGLLARGGMGSVYKMVRGELEFRVAVKIMHRDLAARPEFVKLFLDEARILKQVGDHENLVRILDYAKLSDGVPFIVMELLDGRSLGSAMRAQGIASKPFDRGAALQIVHEICSGVFELHSQGIVHRDLKPDNVFLQKRHTAGPDGAVKILDCGLAYKQEAPYEKGVLQGTPKYMAPEQVRGDEVSPQTDLYAIALILCEMLLGRLPFDLPAGAGVKQLLDAHLWLPPLPLSQFLPWISPAAEAVILSALHKDPSQRPRSAFELQSKIYLEAERLRTGRPPEVGPGSDGNITTPTPMTFDEIGAPTDDARTDPASHTQPMGGPAPRKVTMRMETAPTHPAGPVLWQPPASSVAPLVAPFAMPPVSPVPSAVHRTPDPRAWPSQSVVPGMSMAQPVAEARSERGTPAIMEARPFDARSSQPRAPSLASSSDTSTARSLSYEPRLDDGDSREMGRSLRRRVLIRATVAAAGLALGATLIVGTVRLGSSPARTAASPTFSAVSPEPPAPRVPAVALTAAASASPVPAVSSSSPPAASVAPAAASLPLPSPARAVVQPSAAPKAAAARPIPVKPKPKPAASDGSDELFRPWPEGQ